MPIPQVTRAESSADNGTLSVPAIDDDGSPVNLPIPNRTTIIIEISSATSQMRRYQNAEIVLSKEICPPFG